MSMKKKDIKYLKERFKPIHERGREMFGKERYDKHVKDILVHFDYDIDDRDIKEIFGI
jgi:hypothetical protein